MIIPTMPYGAIADQNGNMTPEFYNFLMQLIQLLNQNLGQNGVIVQSQITDDIALLSLTNGTIIYNSDTQQYKGYQNGILTTFTTV